MNLQTSNLADLNVFFEVATNLNFSKAATQLRMSKSTVSERLSKLESDLGQSLFVRTTRKVRLTELGETFYKRVSILLKGVKDAEDEINGMVGKPRGLVRVSAPRGYEESYIVKSLVNFHEQFPEIEMKIDFTDHLVNLIEEGYDLALRVGDLRDSSLISKKVANHNFRFVCSPKYLQKHRTIRDLNHLNYDEYIEFRMGHGRNWKVAKIGTSSFKELANGKIQSNSIKFIKTFLSHGNGFSLLPDFLCADEILRGELSTFLPNYAGKEMKVYLLYPQRRFVLPRITMLIDALSGRNRPTKTQ